MTFLAIFIGIIVLPFTVATVVAETMRMRAAHARPNVRIRR